MINNDMRLYDFYVYGDKNEYGQKQLSNDVKGKVSIAIYTTNQSIQDNINYRNASYIGLTNDNTISDNYVIKYGNEKLKVLYIQPLGRYKQVYLALV